MAFAAESMCAEEKRIQKAYARRRSGNLYSRFDRAYLFMVQEREQGCLELLARYGFAQLQNKKILEIGCGNGDWLRDFIKWGAPPEKLFGVDLIADRVAEAMRLCPHAVEIRQGNAAQLPFSDEIFDLVFQSTVFTSVINNEMKRRIASEMRRVLKPDGLILWYDFHINNPRNPDVKGVKLREIQELFSNCEIRMKRITLAPPIARRVATYSWLLCYCLSRIPWLCSHYIGVIRKKPLSLD
jgi:ubiquinone/menaquinone biosynthesis C-methylase UbiE